MRHLTWPNISIYLLLLLVQLSMAKKLPDIEWNSAKPPHDRHELYAALGDSIDILCPHFDEDVPEANTEQTIIYRVSQHDYDKCRLTENHQAFGRCTNPYKASKWTATFRQFSPMSSSLEYKPGHTYYFISTSTGSQSGLDNVMGGLCQSHNLKMMIHVTDRNGNIGPHHRHKHHHHHHHKQQHQQQVVDDSSTTSGQQQLVTLSSQPTAPWLNPNLWAPFLEKVASEDESKRLNIPLRGQRVLLDGHHGNERDRYPVYEESPVDYIIHEVGEMETLMASSSFNSIILLLIISLLFLR